MSEIGSDRPSPVANIDPYPPAEFPRRPGRRRLLVAIVVAVLVLVVAAGGVAFTLTRPHSSQPVPVPVTAGRLHEVDLPTLLISSVPLVGAQQAVTSACPERPLDIDDASRMYGGTDGVHQDLVNNGFRRGRIRCWTSGATTISDVLLQFDTDIDAANFGTKVRAGAVENSHFTEHPVSGIPGAASYTRDVDPANLQRLTALAVGHRGDVMVQIECICPQPVRPTTVEQVIRAQLLQL